MTSTETALPRAHPVVEPGDAESTAIGRSATAGWRRKYALTLAVGDLLAMAIGSVVAAMGRLGGLSDRLRPQSGGPSYVVIGFIGAAAWVVTMAAAGVYGTKTIGSGPDEYRRVFDGALRFLAVVAVAVFLLKLNLARGYVAIAVPVALVLTTLIHHLFRDWLFRQRVRGRYVRNVLVVGSERATRDLIDHFKSSGVAEFAIVGACVPDSCGRGAIGKEAVPIVGRPNHAWDAAQRVGADVIAVADANTLSAGGLKALARQIEGSNVDLMAVPSLTDVAGPRITVSLAAGLPLLCVGTPELRGARRAAKETFERLVAALTMILLSPFLVLIGLLVRLTSRGPAFFRQERVGLNGRLFRIWKFRTMTAGADRRLAEVMHLNEFDSVLFKLRADPRVTSFGRFLRKWSLDELPQLWNVVRGQMSLVGPRPPLAAEVELYGDDAHRRLLVKPGITGLWQVSGRSGLSWEETVQLDLHYVDNWSLMMDIVLLAKTIKAVLHRKGAW